MESVRDVFETQVSSGEFIWTVKNFSWLDDLVIHSQQFELFGNKWKLRLFPSGGDEESKGFLSLYLRNHGENKISAGYTFALKRDLKQKREFQPLGIVCTHVLSNQWGLSKFISRSDVLNESKGYLQNDTLQIKCTIAMVKQQHSSQQSQPIKQTEQVINDYAKLVESSKHRQELDCALFIVYCSSCLNCVAQRCDAGGGRHRNSRSSQHPFCSLSVLRCHVLAQDE